MMRALLNTYNVFHRDKTVFQATKANFNSIFVKYFIECMS